MIVVDYSNLRVDGDIEKYSPQIHIYAPAKSEKGDYSCRVEMSGFGQMFEKEVFGISPQQALILALRQVNYMILNSSEYEAGKVYLELSDGSTASLEPEMLGEDRSGSAEVSS